MMWFFQEHVYQEEPVVWRKIVVDSQQGLERARCIGKRRRCHLRSQRG